MLKGRYLRSQWSDLAKIRTRPRFYACPPYLQVQKGWDQKQPKKGWMDELGFYVHSTVFQSFRDDGRVNMKGSVQ